MSYRKQISYLEERKNGERIRNAGYAKLENTDKKYIITLQINGLQVMEGKDLQVYLQTEKGEKLLCESKVTGGAISCKREKEKSNSREEVQEIRIPTGDNTEIAGYFGKTFAKQERPVPKDETKVQERTVVPDMKENKTIVKAETTVSQDRKKENILQMKDTKWEQLSSIYPHIHPFRDTREFLSVGPEDFVIFRERCYQMTHNSFLLHGYYNYRHLLLMRQEKKDQVLYYIGVPGNFYEREKQVARMFGFESFEGSREPAWEGDFGYYMISVEL